MKSLQMKQNLKVRLINENLVVRVRGGKRTVTKSGENRIIKLEENPKKIKIKTERLNNSIVFILLKKS